LSPRGIKYPCGATNRMTLLQQFPTTSTATNRDFFETKMKRFVDLKAITCEK